jgi:hypothetical protein
VVSHATPHMRHCPLMDQLTDRLAAGRRVLSGLGPAIVAGEPWPLSKAYGAEPESDWGPKEVLAHVAEMAPYWMGQIETLVAAPAGSEPPPFGRVATDTTRIDRIGQDRELLAADLLARIDAGLGEADSRVRELTPDDAARRGVHGRLGEMTVAEIVERFIVGHFEEHLVQLDEILARRGMDDSPSTD